VCTNPTWNSTDYPGRGGCMGDPDARCLDGRLRNLCADAREMIGAFTMLCLFISALLAVYHLLFENKPKEVAAP